MKCSICIATYNKPAALDRTLESIFRQRVTFDYEVIVVDDGSSTGETAAVCSKYPVIFKRIRRPSVYRNPSVARNTAYRAAEGEIIITQSDDVIHHSGSCIERLVNDLRPGTFLLATVVNVDGNGAAYSDPKGKGYGDKLETYVSPTRRRPLFFLGSLYRRDLYAVGGNDEEFVCPSGEDRWFGLCLTMGQRLRPVYSDSIVGHHQAHPHCRDYAAIQVSQRLIAQKIDRAQKGEIPWQASGGSWPYPPAGGDCSHR